MTIETNKHYDFLKKDEKYITGWMLYFFCAILIAGGCQQNKDKIYEKLPTEEKRSAENALLGLKTRDGLETTLFASEEMLVNPTNMDIDYRGRVWVTEGFNYRPDLNPENPLKEEGDRILILEDTDGDGRADSRKIFYQGNDINSALGILVLGNKVIVSRSPDVFIFTDTDGDDKADKKEVLFTGIGGEQHDHGVHAFVFGPDGKLYFNFGNEGQIIKDAKGNIVKDILGNEVIADGKPYHQGMVFRCNPDGSEFEVLAHNFRNNYEVTIDSYGTLWQSDNDDDGNESVRINYVMEYGNYGYQDGMTGAGWRTRRTGMAQEIPDRHWHQNDPGVVPNLLYTGAGAPSGIAFYEGELLPEIFQNQIIHADAGPNIVRVYPVSEDGAGYKATIENILEGARDQWFRPVDVTVAPDGSIFVADWYDPGVGGHQMGDQQKGRIFRIAPEDTPYHIPSFAFSTPRGAAEALENPNMNVRSKAWMRLHQWGPEAEPALVALWNSENPRYRARALWLLSKIEGRGEHYIRQALKDSNPDIRITGLRAARQLDGDIIPFVKQLVDDPSPQVRREAAIALHYNHSPEAPKLWTRLALQYSGHDRWQLEALGIGAAGQWTRFFGAWLEEIGSGWNSAAGRDIVWRSRAEGAVPLLAELIEDPSTDKGEKLRYFRAFDFHEDTPVKRQELISLLDGESPDGEMITVLALKHLDRSALAQSLKVQQALVRTLEMTKNTYAFLDLVGRYRLRDQNHELLELMLAYPDSSLGADAAKLLLENEGNDLVAEVLEGNDTERKKSAIDALAHTGSSESRDILQFVILDETQNISIRKQAVEAIGTGWYGKDKLAELVMSRMIPRVLESTAAEVLMDSWRDEMREVARQYLGAGDGYEENVLAPVSSLVTMEGDRVNGKKIFEQSCQICHQVGGAGTPFGPALTVIGDKLPKEGLYEAILEPGAGISFDYEGYILELNDGSRAAGIIASETETEVLLRAPGGYNTAYKQSDIVSITEMDRSFMPDNLESGMTQQELVDLVEYLSSLRKENMGALK